MKKYYISARTGLSGICKYSSDFYELVLKENGYEFIDSGLPLTSILSQITSLDQVHIEVGIFQKKEIEILFAMLNANYTNVNVTLHDPPLLKYPLHHFKNSFINNMSKFYDVYINNFRGSGKYIKKIKNIYVLSKKGSEEIKRKYKVDNVCYIPHIINENEIKKNDLNTNNFLYLGFIGKNKGLEYALQLHQRLITDRPEINFYVIGRALGKNKHYYKLLKKKYIHNVHFMGYVPDDQVDRIFQKVSFSLILFKNYKFYYPVSGSLLYCLKKGIIPFTNNVNTISELVKNEVTGIYLSGDPDKDVKAVLNVLANKKIQEQMKNEIYKYMLFNHTAPVVTPELQL